MIITFLINFVYNIFLICNCEDCYFISENKLKTLKIKDDKGEQLACDIRKGEVISIWCDQQTKE